MIQDHENNLSGVVPTIATGNGAASTADIASADRSPRTGPTEPRTTQGKDRSNRNALKHGIFSQAVLLKGESRAEYDALLNGLRENLQPEGTLEEMLVEKLAMDAWRLRRLFIAEAAENQRSFDSQRWKEVDRQAEAAANISGIQHSLRRRTDSKNCRRRGSREVTRIVKRAE